MKSREQELMELIADSNLVKKSFKKVIWQYKSAESAESFENWLEKRIALEIELAEIRKNKKKYCKGDVLYLANDSNGCSKGTKVVVESSRENFFVDGSIVYECKVGERNGVAFDSYELTERKN